MVKKIRIQRILIESTAENEPVWIHVTGQEVHYDNEGNQLQVLPSNHFAHFMLSEKATTIYNFFDPVLKSDNINSGAGIAIGVIQSALEALQEKYGGEIEPNFLCL